MEPTLNLLLTLHPLAPRQDENFTTAALVNLFRHLATQRPETLLAILNGFGGERCPFDPGDIPFLEFETWASTPHGIPDIRIQTATKLLLVEVKVTAEVTPPQVSDYLTELRSSRKYSHRRLVLLTRYPVPFDLDDDVGTVRWYELADLLDAHRPPSHLQPVAFLTDQFLEFAYGQTLMVAQLRSGISRGLRKYQSSHREDSIFTSRIRRLSKLAPHEDLKGFHDLLLMMEEALRRAAPDRSAKLDSGQQEGGWIGYNLQDMHYYLYVRLSRPEVVVFQDYTGSILREAIPRDRGHAKTTAGRTTWNNELDLASSETSFFTAPKSEQLRLLEDFFLTSKGWADEIEATSRPVGPPA